MSDISWNKVGQVYVPDGVGLFKTHAARPIPVRLNESTLRIFFSSRDETDSMLPNYVDLDSEDLTRIKKINERCLLNLGMPGEFDDSGVTLASAVVSEGRTRFYYTGWKRRRVVSFELAIGIADYDDNSTSLTKVFRGPILHQDRFNPLLVAGPFVIKEDGKYKMWYCSGTDWQFPDGNAEPIYTVFYAESENGIDWVSNPEPVIPYLYDGEVISAPWVVKTSTGYKMWYSTRGHKSKKEKNYTIGYAESSDGINWTRLDDKAGIGVSEEGWDSEMVCYPAVFNHKDKTYMVYSGNGVGRGGIGLAISSEQLDIVDW